MGPTCTYSLTWMSRKRWNAYLATLLTAGALVGAIANDPDFGGAEAGDSADVAAELEQVCGC